MRGSSGERFALEDARRRLSSPTKKRPPGWDSTTSSRRSGTGTRCTGRTCTSWSWPSLRPRTPCTPTGATTGRQYENAGYDVALEQPIEGDGVVDIVAERAGERVAIEIETGKSDIKMNIEKTRLSGFDRVILLATSPSAVSACQRALDSVPREARRAVELMTWLDVE